MAFTTTFISENAVGDQLERIFTYESTDADTGGDVTTGLRVITYAHCQVTGAAVSATVPSINETLPLTNSGGVVTIKTAANEVGILTVRGY